MTRREAIAAILARARADNRQAYVLVGGRPMPTEVRKGAVPDDAVWMCVSGDEKWERLPGE